MKTLISDFADLLQTQQNHVMMCRFPDLMKANPEYNKVTIHIGNKYTRIDVGTSGKYMVENETGIIYGIKGYGVPNKKKVYGTLETIDEYYWGEYAPIKVNSKAI